MGADIEITQGGEVIKPGDASLSVDRTARGTVGLSVGEANVEFMAWGEVDDLLAVVGIVTAGANLATYVGGDEFGIGYNLATGEIVTAGGVIVSADPAEKGEIVGVQFDASAGAVTFWKQGTAVYTVTLDSGLFGATFYPAASIGSQLEADLSVFMNAGQRSFEYPLADSEGWYSIPTTINPIRIATDGYISAPDDEPPNQTWEGRISDGSLTNVRALSFWPWGSASSAGSAAQFTFEDPAGVYDGLISANVRGLSVTVQELPDASAALSSAVLTGVYSVERVDVLDDDRKRLTLRGQDAELDAPVQSRLYLPNLPEDVANRPAPIRFGAVRSVTPDLVRDNVTLSGAPLIYQIADTAIAGVGVLRDKGDPLTLGADFTIEDGAQQIALIESPVGKLTLDLSSLGGGGATSLAPTTVAGWDTSLRVTEVSGDFVFADESYGLPPGVVVTSSYLEQDATLTAGRSYSYVLAVDSMQQQIAVGARTRLSICGEQTGGAGGYFPSEVYASHSGAGTFTGSFTATATGPVSLALRTVSGGVEGAVVSRFDLFEASATTIDTLQAATLQEYAREFLGRRRGLPDSRWSAADAAAIDSATGYGLGISITEPATTGDVLQRALVGFTACMWRDKSGVIRFSRMVPPASRDAAGTITRDQMLIGTDLKITPDLAPGLTTRMGGRRNWTVLDPTDFVTDFADVPMAVRKELSREFRAVRATVAQFPAEFAHALGAADIVPTLIDNPEHVQSEIDRIGLIYQTVPFFYEIQLPIDALGEYELDQVWVVKYSRYGLGDGKKCLLYSITEDRINRRAKLGFWG